MVVAVALPCRRRKTVSGFRAPFQYQPRSVTIIYVSIMHSSEHNLTNLLPSSPATFEYLVPMKQEAVVSYRART